jgi:hypothetical protein
MPIMSMFSFITGTFAALLDTAGQTALIPDVQDLKPNALLTAAGIRSSGGSLGPSILRFHDVGFSCTFP